MGLNFSKKGPTTRQTLRAALFFKGLGKFSGKNPVLESFYSKVLGLQFINCRSVVKFMLAA